MRDPKANAQSTRKRLSRGLRDCSKALAGTIKQIPKARPHLKSISRYGILSFGRVQLLGAGRKVTQESDDF